MRNRRIPRESTERAYYETLRELAESDPKAFEEDARARISGSAGTAEMAGILRAAAHANPEVESGIYFEAFEWSRGDPARGAVREVATRLLLKRAGQPWACERLLDSVIADPRSTVADRAQAADAIFSRAPGNTVGWYLARVGPHLDPQSRAHALAGLARNPAPEARDVLNDVASRGSFDPGVQAEAAAVANAQAEPPGEAEE